MKILLIASIVLINSIYGQNEQKYNNYQYITDSLSEIGEFEQAILYLENNLAQAKKKKTGHNIKKPIKNYFILKTTQSIL